MIHEFVFETVQAQLPEGVTVNELVSTSAVWLRPVGVSVTGQVLADCVRRNGRPATVTTPVRPRPLGL